MYSLCVCITICAVCVLASFKSMLLTYNVQFAYLYPRKARATPLAHRGEVGDFCRLYRSRLFEKWITVCFVNTYPLDSDLSGG